MTARSLMFSEMRPASSFEDRFNHWYDTEHIPLRMGIQGFEGAQRYIDAANRNYLAVYELTSLAVFGSPEFHEIKTRPSETTAWMLANVEGFTRYLADESTVIGDTRDEAREAPVLHAVLLEVPEAELETFDAWYEKTYLPGSMNGRGCLMVRNLVIASGEPGRYNRLTLHYLSAEHRMGSQLHAIARGYETSSTCSNAWLRTGRETTFAKHAARHRGRHCIPGGMDQTGTNEVSGSRQLR